MRFTLICLSLLIFNCVDDRPSLDPLTATIKSENLQIKNVIDSTDKYEIQIKLSEIKRRGDSIDFIDFEYNVDDTNYFYPASTVKFPIALLALEKSYLSTIVNSETTYFVENDSIKHTIRDDIRQIFAISDNDAYNRLYEYLGRDYINSRLRVKNLGPVRIAHRLSIPYSNNPVCRAISFWDNDSLIYIQDSVVANPIQKLNLKKQQKGIGFYKDSTLSNEPIDFSEKNYLPITTLHNLMKSVIFPKAHPEFKTFILGQNDREFLLQSMHNLPKEAGYDPTEYYDSYVKFFMFGDSEDSLPSHIKIYNKVGYAYGYLTDCAYIKDEKTNTEFILTATIHVNKNGIFNDDTYEYDTLGIPFLASLGREIHNQLKPTE